MRNPLYAQFAVGTQINETITCKVQAQIGLLAGAQAVTAAQHIAPGQAPAALRPLQRDLALYRLHRQYLRQARRRTQAQHQQQQGPRTACNRSFQEFALWLYCNPSARLRRAFPNPRKE